MPTASTSRVQLRYIKETNFGVTPVAGNGVNLRMTGESLNFNLTKESSEEINATRSISSVIATSAEATGGVQFELSYDEYDPFLEALLQNTWSAFGTNGVGTAFTGTYATGSITAGVTTTGSSAFTNLKAGQWFSVAGSTAASGANNNKLFRVSKITPPTTTVITLDTNTPATAGTDGGSTSTIRCSRLSNGVTQPSFTLEKEMNDAGEFFAYRGMTVSSMSLNMATSSRTTGEFTFMGRDSIQQATTTLPGTMVASTAFNIMSGVSASSCALWANGAPLTATYINSISFNYDNSLRMQNALCNLGAIGIGSGSIVCSMDIEVYFATGATFYSQFLNNSNIELAFTAFDNAGNGYVFTFPQANISSYSVTAGGKDADLMAQITVTGLNDAGNADAALRKVCFIDRIGAALTP